jgi:hypothetical protein
MEWKASRVAVGLLFKRDGIDVTSHTTRVCIAVFMILVLFVTWPFYPFQTTSTPNRMS